MNNNNYIPNTKTTAKTSAYIFILFIYIILPILGISFVVYLFKKKGTTNWLPNVDDEEKIERTANRGTIISVILNLTSVLQAFLKVSGSSAEVLLVLFGFFMTAVIGYMGDQGFGKDDGFSVGPIARETDDEKKKNKNLRALGAKLKYVFGSLYSFEFLRYIVTVFLDMFISNPIQSIIISLFENRLNIFKNTVKILPNVIAKLLNILIFNFDNILQSFVGFITFLSYTNDTRFRWAYPGNDVDPSLLISSGTIKLATAISGVVYLIANLGADFNIIDGVKLKVGKSLSDRLDRKMMYVIIVIMMLTIGSMQPFPFMNYSNLRYTIAPLQNYKSNDFWGYNADNEREANKNVDKNVCKTGTMKTCETDEKGNLILDKNKNIHVINKKIGPKEEKVKISYNPSNGTDFFIKKFRNKNYNNIGWGLTTIIVLINITIILK